MLDFSREFHIVSYRAMLSLSMSAKKGRRFAMQKWVQSKVDVEVPVPKGVKWECNDNGVENENGERHAPLTGKKSKKGRGLKVQGQEMWDPFLLSTRTSTPYKKLVHHPNSSS